jgi:hypothetical protein
VYHYIYYGYGLQKIKLVFWDESTGENVLKELDYVYLQNLQASNATKCRWNWTPNAVLAQISFLGKILRIQLMNIHKLVTPTKVLTPKLKLQTHML